MTDTDWLVDYLRGQRWYGAADQQVLGARFTAREPVTEDIDWALVELRLQPGPDATYQLFVDRAARRDVAERAEAVRWLFPELPAHRTELLAGEQSNTSVVVDDDVIVKVFRRVPPGPNPDAEVVRRLWDGGFRAVPEPLAETSREGRDLAVARRFLRGATDGWTLALHDGTFSELVETLGAVTAELHVALAAAFGARDGDPAAWAAAMHRQLRRTALPAGVDPRPRYARLGQLRSGAGAGGGAGAAVRAHGDYHLGQVLRCGDAWYVLDFEGEPARPVEERTEPSSPLRDVAGMVRSFSYAAVVGGHGPDWEPRVRRRFLDGYLGHPRIAELLPAAWEPVLAAFELDKAVYELAYERANRPDWAHVPLAAIERLTAP